MLCSECGNVLLDTANVCTGCGTSVQHAAITVKAITGEPNPPSSSIAQDSTQPLSSHTVLPEKLSAAGAFGLAASWVYLVSVFVVFVWYWANQENLPFAFGYVLGSASIPAIIVLVYYKKKNRKASTARVLTVLASWALIANLISMGAGGQPSITEADIPVLAREAAGLAPVKYPNDPVRTAVRDCFKEAIAQNQKYFAEIGKINLQGLYTPKSYVDPEESKRIIDQVEFALHVEAWQESSLSEILERYKAKINALKWNESEKQAFTKGFEKSYQDNIVLRKPVIDSEKEWFTAIHDLYIFVSENQRHFQISGNKVLISKHSILLDFNDKIHHVNALKAKFETASSAFKESQRKQFEHLGVSSRDFGVSQ